MGGRILSVDGQKRDIWHDMGDGSAVVELVEDCTPIVQQVRDLGETGGRAHEAMRLEAIIPAHVMRRSYLERWDDADWRRWANDPDNRDFRIPYDGRVKTL